MFITKISVLFSILSSICANNYHVISHHGEKNSKEIISQFDVSTITSCVMRCSTTPGCVTVGVNDLTNTKKCILFSDRTTNEVVEKEREQILVVTKVSVFNNAV